MKKTGIVTLFYKNYNYGAVLQAYALQNCLNDLGVENEVLRLDFVHGSAGYRTGKKAATQKTVRFSRSTMRNKLRRAISAVLLAGRYRRFDRFMHERFRTSDERYTDENIQQANDRYDCFITGSDQVWNPGFSFDSTFLEFVDDRHRKISYAASIGMGSVEEEYLRYMVPLIDRLDAISVREPSAVKLLEGHVHKQVRCVLDPTLLLPREKWEELCCPRKTKKDYIFVYLLGNSAQNHRMVQAAAEKLHRRVVLIPFGAKRVNRSVLWLHGRWALGASPESFLTMLRDAEYVITDSFHGTVFSLIFHKAFCVIELENGKKKSPTNARLYDLLETVGLEERMQFDAGGIGDVLQREIDYGPVDARLAERIRDSRNYLRQALELDGPSPETE